MTMSWLITIVLTLFIGRIIYVEVLCGRRSKAFLKKTTEEIQKIHAQATASYRAKFGRDPTGTFPLIDEQEVKKS